jgi:hypothetical protein
MKKLDLILEKKNSLIKNKIYNLLKFKFVL